MKVAVFLIFAVELFGSAPRIPRTGNELLWRNPGAAERLDFTHGPGGRKMLPRPPLRFVREDLSGSSAKVFVRDGRGRLWNVKFGVEVKSEVFSSRIAWAAGYFVEPMYFVKSGRIGGVTKLSRRAAEYLDESGRFENARFQLREPGPKFMEENNWSWSYNPFFGTRELAGLKVVMMLTSNWDNKDARDAEEGINTAIFERPGRRPRYVYAFTDWGQTLGRWGGAFRRSQWNCRDYESDTADFVRGVKDDGTIEWGYRGRHTGEFTEDISVRDVRWVMRTIGRIRDVQLAAGLAASGADRREAACFTRAIRGRIEVLRRVGAGRRERRQKSEVSRSHEVEEQKQNSAGAAIAGHRGSPLTSLWPFSSCACVVDRH